MIEPTTLGEAAKGLAEAAREQGVEVTGTQMQIVMKSAVRISSVLTCRICEVVIGKGVKLKCWLDDGFAQFELITY